MEYPPFIVLNAVRGGRAGEEKEGADDDKSDADDISSDDNDELEAAFARRKVKHHILFQRMRTSTIPCLCSWCT